MKIIRTDLTEPQDLKTQWEKDQVYNGLDCCVTAEVLDELLPQLDETTSATYDLSRSLQGPALEMRLRGLRIDGYKKALVIDEYFEKIDHLERNITRMALDGLGMNKFSWRSNDDLKELFYDKLSIPVIRRGGRPTVNRTALEKLGGYTIAQQFVSHLICMRELGKKISFLKTSVDPDGRIRTSYNIAGTSTGRFSSSFSEFGTGTNLQNIEESLRQVFIADKRKKFAKCDAAQIQSRIVGAIEWNLFNDGTYLDACEKADLHTVVAKMVWPFLPWTGDLKKDKAIAETPYYRHYTYRFMCKKLGHGSNFEGQPATLSEQARIPINLVREFQPKYYAAFPAHHKWHEWVANQIATVGELTGITGRRRQFWGRRDDPKTIREAVAYDPQNSEAYIVNGAMLNIWHARTAEIMMHDHDALTFQYPEEQEDEIVPKLMEQLRFPIPLAHGRMLEIPYECKVGWNRGEWSETNPDGLKDYIPGDKRKRQEETHILDRKLR